MAIVGIPDVGVLELVHVHLEGAVTVEVHVRNEELCAAPSETLPF
jgi:hypothetical protein